MRRRRAVSYAALVALILVGLVAAGWRGAVHFDQTRLTWAKAVAVKAGMTQAEVVALLGPPTTKRPSKLPMGAVFIVFEDADGRPLSGGRELTPEEIHESAKYATWEWVQPAWTIWGWQLRERFWVRVQFHGGKVEDFTFDTFAF